MLLSRRMPYQECAGGLWELQELQEQSPSSSAVQSSCSSAASYLWQQNACPTKLKLSENTVVPSIFKTTQ